MKKTQLWNENRVYLAGRLTEDPVLKYTPSKVPFLRVTLAVNLVVKNKKETLYIPVVIWSELAIECSTKLSKGSQIRIEGRLVNREYTFSRETEEIKYKTVEVVAHKIEFFEEK